MNLEQRIAALTAEIAEYKLPLDANPGDRAVVADLTRMLDLVQALVRLMDERKGKGPRQLPLLVRKRIDRTANYLKYLVA